MTTMPSFAPHRVGVGLLERLEPILGKENGLVSAESPLDPMTSSTSSTGSELELVELRCGPPTVSSVECPAATFSWAPLSNVPEGLNPTYMLEIQQLENAESSPGSTWLSVYRGNKLTCKVSELKSGRSYAARLLASVESGSLADETSHVAGVEVRVLHADHIVFATPSAVPSGMQPPSLVQRARNALKLKWTVPEDPGGVFDLTYVLQVSPAPQGLEGSRTYMGFVEVYRGPERSFKVVKLQPGVRYTSRVQAINPVGEGPFSLCSAYTTQATVPTQPQPPTVQSATASTLTLRWTPPADNGSPVTGYSLERDDGAGGDFALVYGGPNTTFTLKGLRPGTGYRFRLRADNDEGRSIWSATTTLLTGAAPPSSPEAMQVTSAGRTSARLVWRAPEEDGGSNVLAFEVELQAISRAATACMGTDWLKVFDNEVPGCTIESLCPGCAYQVRVRAKNAAGCGSWTLPLQFTTAAHVPEAPQTLHAARCSPSSIYVLWAPPRHDGGSKVLQYRLEMAPAGCHCGMCPQALAAAPAAMLPYGPPGVGFAVPPPPPPPPPPLAAQHGSAMLRPTLCPAVTPVTVYTSETVGWEQQGLQPGCRYIFRVQALNAQGASPWTEWMASATTADVPLTPAPPAVSCVTAADLVLSWQVPPGQGAPVTQYSVEVATLPQAPAALLQLPGRTGIVTDPWVATLGFKLSYRGPETGCQVRGLEPFTAYAFRLCAHNDVGPSQWSVCVAAVTGHAPPTCPKSLAAQPSSSSLVALSWAPPERDFGEPVVSYTVDMAAAGRSGHGGGKNAGNGSSASSWSHVYTGPGSACQAGGLAPGRTYQFRVRACNACGWSPYSPVVTATTLPAPPSAPGKPAASGRTSSGFRVRWEEPEHTYGAHVTSYVLEVSEAGTDEWAAIYTGSDIATKVSSLLPATKYLVRVAAVNSAGQGAYSECEAVTTLLLPPLPPSDLSVKEAGSELAMLSSDAAMQGASPAADAASGASTTAVPAGSQTSVLVSWQEPASDATHAAVLGYEIVATPKPGSEAAAGPGGGVIKLNVAGRRCDARLEGVVPGCLYGIRVRSVGVEGTGHSGWSEEVGVATRPRPDMDALSVCSSGGAGVASGGSATGGMSQRRSGTGAKRAAKQRQQAAAGAAAPPPQALATTVSSNPAEDGASGPNGSNSSASRSRARAGGASSRVAAAATVVVAKKLRKATALERLADETPRWFGCAVEAVAKTLFGPNWRREYIRQLRTFGKYMFLLCVVVLVVLVVLSKQ
ncbi:hypothetical protein Agub_g12561 [Astrephomene gubernaculifera]|uniref:Fibronectin type-III domain-containing protein n=1 Tax=Astrephomene gubernaculifera TaxID=47775 RepID=A0AAD3E0R5_9CHLO|nr:hypothetical protein Agub_g12561 [Astrephomene gubernaculifera]